MASPIPRYHLKPKAQGTDGTVTRVTLGCDLSRFAGVSDGEPGEPSGSPQAKS